MFWCCIISPSLYYLLWLLSWWIQNLLQRALPLSRCNMATQVTTLNTHLWITQMLQVVTSFTNLVWTPVGGKYFWKQVIVYMEKKCTSTLNHVVFDNEFFCCACEKSSETVVYFVCTFQIFASVCLFINIHITIFAHL